MTGRLNLQLAVERRNLPSAIGVGLTGRVQVTYPRLKGWWVGLTGRLNLQLAVERRNLPSAKGVGLTGRFKVQLPAEFKLPTLG